MRREMIVPFRVDDSLRNSSNAAGSISSSIHATKTTTAQQQQCYRWKFANLRVVLTLVLVYTITTSSVLSRKMFQPYMDSLYNMIIMNNDHNNNNNSINMRSKITITASDRSNSRSISSSTTTDWNLIGMSHHLTTTTTNESNLFHDEPIIKISNYTLDLYRARDHYMKNTNSDSTIDIGILSKKEASFFYNIQHQIDSSDDVERCKRYGGKYEDTKTTTTNNNKKKRRRLFYGTLIANEPWELYEIIATEVYGIFDGLVFVEGNRTQNYTPRKPNFVNQQHQSTFQLLFGSTNVQIRLHVSEETSWMKKRKTGLAREHDQRNEIIKGWKELGMNENDIGIIADIDETFHRDFLRALQICDNIKALEYTNHYCNVPTVKLIGTTRVYESTPECIVQDRVWFHPDLIIGHCIDGIATSNTNNNHSNNSSIIHHPTAPRTKHSFLRAKGWGKEIDDFDKYKTVTNNQYPLWDASDFRRTPGGHFVSLQNRRRNNNDNIRYDKYTAFHFHNFVFNLSSTRYKYYTYGHPDNKVYSKRLEEISNDMQMMYRCVMNMSTLSTQKWKHIKGGYNHTLPFYPIYFHDHEYRMDRMNHVRTMVLEDEQRMMMIEKQQDRNRQSSTTIDHQSSRRDSSTLTTNPNTKTQLQQQQEEEVNTLASTDSTTGTSSSNIVDTTSQSVRIDYFDLSYARTKYNPTTATNTAASRNKNVNAKHHMNSNKDKELVVVDDDALLDVGIVSKKDSAFFRSIQNEIDQYDNTERCKRYGGTYNTKNKDTTNNQQQHRRRRIFYGALSASEPWEVYEIIAAEVYGIYTGIVFVEGNRTQNLTPRQPSRLHHQETFQLLFGIMNSTMVQVRLYVQEGDPEPYSAANNKNSVLSTNKKKKNQKEGLAREHDQRAEIIKGWKEMGMNNDDIGIIADCDETFTRDYLRAIQVCDNIPFIEYHKHYCHYSNVKGIGYTRVYESTPECITKDRVWFHPDMIIGYCIDGIGSDSIINHPTAPRQPNHFVRDYGWGDGGNFTMYNTIKNKSYPLWNAADFRRTPGGGFVTLRSKLSNYERNRPPAKQQQRQQQKQTIKYDTHTAYHFHNFFYNLTKNVRFKYKTYGHPDKLVDMKRLYNISNDLLMMYKCVLNLVDDKEQVWKRVIGGYNSTHPFYPIYFQDDVYRKERTEHVKQMVVQDELYYDTIEKTTTT